MRRGDKSAVDTNVEAPYGGFMNLQVPPELEAKLTRLAAETGRTADQVALDLLASSIDHDEWFRSEVEKIAPPHAKVECSGKTTSPVGWIGAIAADARPLDDGCCG